MKYPLNTPYLHGNEKKYLCDVIDSGWLSRGEYNKRFETEFAKFCGVKYALSVTSGTVAVQVLLMGAGLRNKKVAIPAYTCMSVAQAVVHAPCIPIFIDIELDSLGIDFNSLIRMYKKEKFNAVLLNHLYGYIARDTEKIKKWCKENKVMLLEDASEAHGAESKLGIVGSLGRGAAFSCRSEKMIGVGEGGIIVTNDKELYDQAYYFINDARPSEKVRYYTTTDGWNFFMPNALGAIGLAQVEQLPIILQKKRILGEEYLKYFKDKKRPLHSLKQQKGDNPVFWLNVAILGDSISLIREDLLQIMADRGIEMRPGFYPLNTLPSYRKYPTDSTPNADKVGRRLVAFPSATDLELKHLTEIFNTFDSII
jgi:perosamine synthetase